MKRALSAFLFFAIATMALAQNNNACISRKGMHFYKNGKVLYFAGTNYWYGGLLAQGPDSAKGKIRLRKELDFLKKQGITNIRVLVGAEGFGMINGVERVKPALEPQKGQIDPEVLKGLDFLLAELNNREMNAVLFLSNNWEWSGGFLQYLNWHGKISKEEMAAKMTWDSLRDNTSLFYSCEECIESYLNKVKSIITHTNTYTGKKYTDDPAIMAWELANEPRPMRAQAIDLYKQWIKKSAAIIKGLDKKHLITIGTEGFMGTEENIDLFKDIHLIPNIDYMTIHIWPKNWSWFQGEEIAAGIDSVLRKTQQYITTHERIAKEIQMPLVIEEFGLPREHHSFQIGTATSSRDKLFKTIIENIKRSKTEDGPLAGFNFWAFGGFAKPNPSQIFWKDGDDFMGDPPQEEQGLNSVFNSDNSTWKVIRSFKYD